MAETFELLNERLKQRGYSITKARSQVFEALNQKEPQTMGEIIKQLPGIDRASVYRVIALFEQLGIVHRLQIGWKYKLELTDEFHYHHHHISCTNCGLTAPLREDSMLEATITSLATEYGFKPTAHQIEIQGLCNSCKNMSSGV